MTRTILRGRVLSFLRAPQAIDDAVGPRTRAVTPVHMWGKACNMDAIMAVAQKHNLFVLEDACQAVAGGYEGRKLASIGHMGDVICQHAQHQHLHRIVGE